MLEQSEFTHVHVNNEIEFCEIRDMKIKSAVEKALLANRVSYFIRWNDTGFFWAKKKDACVFHVNNAQKDLALDAVERLDDSVKAKMKMLCKKTETAEE